MPQRRAALTTLWRACLQQPAVHRVSDGLGLHGGVDDHALQVHRFDRLDVHGALDGGFEQLLQTVLTEQASEAADLSGVARQARLVVVHAAEELPLDVLGPALDEFFVAEIETVLQIEQADHQAHRQARAARRADAASELAFKAAGQVLTAELLGRPCVARQLRRHRSFEQGPRQSLGQHRQRVPQIDHLVQAGAEKVRRAHRQFPQKSALRSIEFRG